MTALIYAVVGLVVVLLTSLLKKPKWSVKTKQAINTVLSLIAGVITTYFEVNGTSGLSDTVQNSAMLLAASQVIYTFGLKDTAVNAYLTNLNLFGSSKAPAKKTTKTTKK
jgi:uncharacterized protein YacL